MVAGIAESARGGQRVDGAVYAAAVQAATAAYVNRLCDESVEDLRRAIRGESELVRILATWEHRAERIAEREVQAAAEMFGAIAS